MGVKILKNGKVFTSTDSELREALVVDGDRVTFVGSTADAEKHAGSVSHCRCAQADNRAPRRST